MCLVAAVRCRVGGLLLSQELVGEFGEGEEDLPLLADAVGKDMAVMQVRQVFLVQGCAAALVQEGL